MDILEDIIEQSWSGPLSNVEGLPSALLYGAVLSFAATKGPTLLTNLRSALEPHFGKAEERKSLFGGARLSWDGKAEAVVKGDRVRLSFATRVKGKKIADTVRALSVVEGAHDLRLDGTVRRFGQTESAPPTG